MVNTGAKGRKEEFVRSIIMDPSMMRIRRLALSFETRETWPDVVTLTWNPCFHFDRVGSYRLFSEEISPEVRDPVRKAGAIHRLTPDRFFALTQIRIGCCASVRYFGASAEP